MMPLDPPQTPLAPPESSADVPAIEVIELKKAYQTKDVLKGVDIRVERGQIYGYIGPNGSGKTTTVRLLTGMLGDFEGQVKVAGLDVRREPNKVKKRIGFVPESAALYESLTVGEFLLMMGELHKRDPDEIEHKSEALLREFELLPRINSRLASLSKGMRQKTLICSALLHDPEILFLDEPLSGLDVNATILFKQLIRTFADSGRTVFYCSHLMDIVERVCDRISILHEGKIVIEGTFEEIQDQRKEQGHSLESIFAGMTREEDESSRAERILAIVRGE